ncbi:McrC family protein [Pararhodobacter zhoushanensis]|uniref:McrC family protein n=1 Tax=Pararhodobacter zhoushanensis TaxID=2479545 RepID=A0ABT3H446_9RHOB|nr:McrC family protein [Pararhodobacter zhoushanensis]MCW1934518.1 McrC family protein [Pararhodobacter zhoushanensis]
MTAPARVIEIQERGWRYFPRTDLADKHGSSLILPETRKLQAVEITDVPNGARLMALGLIGYLPLTSAITLNIVPKFPIQNLWTMLEVGGESYARILPTLRRYQTTSNPAPIQLLARSFCHYLKNALSAGFERSYYSRTVNGYYKPRVEFGQTIGSYLSRGNPVETVSSVFEFGIDSPINRIVKAACLRFSAIMPRAADWDEDRKLIGFALDALQRVRAQEPGIHDFTLDQTVSFRLRAHYSGLLRVYQLLLTGGGIAFTFEPGGKELPSFLFNLEDIFERFIRQTFLIALRERNIAVLDGNKHMGRLFEDNRSFPTKSDLIFRYGKRNVIGLGEVKYKPKLKEIDRYQIISHVTAAKAPLGILFSPANEGESQKLERLGRLSTGAQFYHYRVDIQGDIRAAQAQMVADVSALLNTPDA